MANNTTIAIIDDDLLVRDATADLVDALGYISLTFASPEQFLSSGQVEKISCLITDLQMPGLNGLDLQDHMLKAGHRIPIIFITAFPNDKARARALVAGAVAFLSKPFDEASLTRSLDLALKQIEC